MKIILLGVVLKFDGTGGTGWKKISTKQPQCPFGVQCQPLRTRPKAEFSILANFVFVVPRDIFMRLPVSKIESFRSRISIKGRIVTGDFFVIILFSIIICVS